MPIGALHHPRRSVLDPIVLDAAVDAGATLVHRIRRDDFVGDVYTSTARLARYDWTGDEAWALQADIGKAWTGAAHAAASLPDWTAASAVPVPAR